MADAYGSRRNLTLRAWDLYGSSVNGGLYRPSLDEDIYPVLTLVNMNSSDDCWYVLVTQV